MITQIAAHVAQAAIDGNDKISIRMSPAELGRIDVKLEFGPDGRVQAVFAADRRADRGPAAARRARS